VGGDEAQPDRARGGARAVGSSGGDTDDEEVEPPWRHRPGRGGTEWPTSRAMADETRQTQGVLGAEAGNRVGEGGSRGRAGSMAGSVGGGGWGR
jgi:hypothetical protein